MTLATTSTRDHLELRRSRRRRPGSGLNQATSCGRPLRSVHCTGVSQGPHSFNGVSTRPWREIDADLFRFTTTDLRDLHLALMAGFERAAVVSPVLDLASVRRALADVAHHEPVTDERLLQALASLVDWQLLDVTQDHSAHYATPEEFERRNLRWSLTSRGDDAVTGVQAAIDSLRHVAGMQPAVLDRIGDDLAELAAHLDDAASDAGDIDVHFRLAAVEGHLAGLVVNVRQFNRSLQSLVGHDGHDETFAEVKLRTVTYLKEFVDGVERPLRRVRTSIDVLRPQTAALFDRAVRGARLPPVAEVDPAVHWIAERARRWEALESWFAPADAARPRSADMIDLARTAINQLLRILERRHEERRRSASLADDFRALARLFADAPTGDDAHELFGAAFGLWSARHAHLPSVEGTARRPHDRWGAVEPVAVAPSLRTTGTVVNRGRPSPVPDPADHRAARALAAAANLADQRRMADALATEGAVRLSTLGPFEVAELAELLTLLGRALDAPASSDGRRRALSADGRIEITVGDDVGHARLATGAGAMTAPDFEIDVTMAGRSEGFQRTGLTGHG